MRYLTIAIVIAAATSIPPIAGAQQPVTNVFMKRHPNIAEAQRLTKRAFDKIVAAQEANEFDLGGHAARAEDLLDRANRELKAAAMDARMHK